MITDRCVAVAPHRTQFGRPAAVVCSVARVLCAGARHSVPGERGTGGAQPQRLRTHRRATQGVGGTAVEVALLGDELVDSEGLRECIGFHFATPAVRCQGCPNPEFHPQTLCRHASAHDLVPRSHMRMKSHTYTSHTPYNAFDIGAPSHLKTPIILLLQLPTNFILCPPPVARLYVLVASILTIAAPRPNPASAGQRPSCRYKAYHKQTGLRRASER